MFKLGRAIVPGGGGEGKEEKVREAKAEVAAEEISNNETDSTLENKREKKIIEQRRDMRIKREEGGLDASDGVGERLEERVGGGMLQEQRHRVVMQKCFETHPSSGPSGSTCMRRRITYLIIDIE